MDSTATTGHSPENTSRISGAASPIATTERSSSAVAASGRKVESLVAAAGNENCLSGDCPTDCTAAHSRVGGGGLGVVIEADPIVFGYQHHPMGQAGPRQQGRPHSISVGPASHGNGRRGQTISQFVGLGQRFSSAMSASFSDSAHNAPPLVRKSPSSSPKVTTCPRPGACSATTGIVSVHHRGGVLVDPAPQCGFGGPIALKRGMDVEVVGGEVQPRTYRRLIATAVGQAKRGCFDDECGRTIVSDGLNQRCRPCSRPRPLLSQKPPAWLRP